MATMRNKPVSFNIDSENELQLFNFACAQENFSRYVKELIKKDLIIRKGQSKGINIRID